ncbi:ATP-binding protein [Deltaproteobacteria bacterium TL4]
MSSIKLTIESQLEHIPLVGLALRSFAGHAAFDEEDSFMIELAVVEAVTNVVEHAYELQPGNLVEIEVLIQPDAILCHIYDKGKPMPPVKVPLINRSYNVDDLDSISDRGRGIALIHQIMDEVTYQRCDEINFLTLKKLYKNLTTDERR